MNISYINNKLILQPPMTKEANHDYVMMLFGDEDVCDVKSDEDGNFCLDI